MKANSLEQTADRSEHACRWRVLRRAIGAAAAAAALCLCRRRLQRAAQQHGIGRVQPLVVVGYRLPHLQTDGGSKQTMLSWPSGSSRL